jgi:hypothetical protein
VRGEAHWAAKFTEEDVRIFRKRYEQGESTRKLAKEKGVAPSGMWAMVTGYAWKHVK